jgi:hypothetical protein
MAKLITLSNATTLVNDFNNLFNDVNVPFVILGNTALHQDLATQAANLAEKWETAIYVPQPAGLYATLLALPKDGCALAPIYDSPNLFAVAISYDKTICYVMTTYDKASIRIAYMSAETH